LAGFPVPSANVNTPLQTETWLAAEQESVRSELDRVVSSSCFRKSPRLIRFLQFVVESTLRGEAGQLKEYRIGVEVFACPPLYDPRLNPIVRLEARRLRTKLELYNGSEGIGDAVHIHIPKGHYSAVFELRPLEIAPDTATGLELPIDSGASDTLPPARNFVRNGAIFLGIALIALGAYWLHSRRVPPPAHQTRSLAVLPFLNLTEKPENEWLSDGLADDLTDSLARVPGLRVVARGSAFRFKDSAEDVQVIAKQLNVTEVLAGSLQTSGDRLRITVQLVRADGYQVWAETYEPHDTFVVEDNISRAVGAALGVRLPESAETDAKRPSLDQREHELYLRGRYCLNRRTARDEWKAIDYFNQALEVYPLDARSYLGLAEAYVVLGANDQAPASQVYPKARSAAQRALELDKGLSGAYATLAQISLSSDWDAGSAEAKFKQALELNPNYAIAHQWYGMLLLLERRFDQAGHEFRKAQDLDPRSLIIAVDLGQLYAYMGDYDAAIEQAHKTLLYDANYVQAHELLGFAFRQKGEYAEAIEEFQKYLLLSGRDPDALRELGVTYAVSGQREKAVAILRELEALKMGYTSPYSVASVNAALGNKDQTYQWLETAISQHSSSCLQLSIDPAFDAFRSEPHFQKLLRLVGEA